MVSIASKAKMPAGAPVKSAPWWNPEQGKWWDAVCKMANRIGMDALALVQEDDCEKALFAERCTLWDLQQKKSAWEALRQHIHPMMTLDIHEEDLAHQLRSTALQYAVKFPFHTDQAITDGFIAMLMTMNEYVGEPRPNQERLAASLRRAEVLAPLMDPARRRCAMKQLEFLNSGLKDDRVFWETVNLSDFWIEGCVRARRFEDLEELPAVGSETKTQKTVIARVRERARLVKEMEPVPSIIKKFAETIINHWRKVDIATLVEFCQWIDGFWEAAGVQEGDERIAFLPSLVVGSAHHGIGQLIVVVRHELEESRQANVRVRQDIVDAVEKLTAWSPYRLREPGQGRRKSL
jgi:hypothetical protein